MASTRLRLKDAAADKFGLVLLSCIATYALLVSIDSSQWSGLSGSIPVLVTVIFSLNAAMPAPPLRGAALGLIAAAIILGAIATQHLEVVFGVSMLLTGLSLLVCVIALLARMAEHSRVSLETVLAVLAAYVMLGLIFTFVDSGIGHIAGTFFAQPNAHSQSDYAYLSYITLTTVGFGDLTPGTGVARSFIILESLTGQIFLVTLVARMVSLFGTERAPMSLRSAIKQEETPE